MKYCIKCGQKLPDEAAFCSGCGCRAGQTGAGTNRPETERKSLVVKLSQRVYVNGILWVIIGILQIYGGWYNYYDFFSLIPVGILNVVLAVGEIRYSKRVKQQPIGIVARFQPLFRPILTFLWNFFLGGIIGIAGSLYYFIAIRGFVMENEAAFRALDPPSPIEDPYY